MYTVINKVDVVIILLHTPKPVCDDIRDSDFQVRRKYI